MKYPFIPENERRRLSHEYLMRVGIVSAFLVAVLGLVGTVALFPAYIRAFTAESAALDTVVSLKNDASSTNAAALQAQLASDGAFVREANDLIRPQLSLFVAAIAQAHRTVRITSITVDQSTPGTVTAVVQGTAPTRDDLIGFRARLMSAIPGVTTDVPPLQLTKKTDVDFTLKVTQLTK